MTDDENLLDHVYIPGLGCACALCKRPVPVSRVVEPGTPEHAVWAAEQARKRGDSEVRMQDWADLTNRPAFRR